jgi:hypothetical protein
VQNFLFDLLEKGLKDKFRFDTAATETATKNELQVNLFDANLYISKASLDLLSAPFDKNTKFLVPYIMEYLPTHLGFIHDHKDFASLGNDEKTSIRQSILTLFSDGDAIAKIWDDYGAPDYPWVASTSDIQEFWKWLEDPSAIGYVSKSDKLWLQKAKQARNPNRALLRPVTLTVASRWLQDRKWEAERAFRWVVEYLNMVSFQIDVTGKCC